MLRYEIIRICCLCVQATTIHLHPLYVMLPCTISASLAFMLPVATPPNAIAFSYGNLKVMDMVWLNISLEPFPLSFYYYIILIIHNLKFIPSPLRPKMLWSLRCLLFWLNFHFKRENVTLKKSCEWFIFVLFSL